MIETNLNIFDCVVLGIMGLSCLIAFFRGLVREVLSLVAWIGAGVVTVMYFEPVALHMQEYFKRPEIAKAAAVVGLYISALICFSIVNIVILKTIKRGGDGGVLDNMLGLVFGAVRGAFIIALGFFLITTVVPKDDYPEWITESKTHPYAERAALLLTRLAPESLSRISGLQKKALEDAKERMKQAEEENGYGERTTHELDEAIESTDNPMSAQLDKFREECGVFGVFGHADAAALTALGLHALQHRGQEAAGIVSHDGEQFYAHRALGLVGDNFNSASVIDKLKGHIAVGHNRYATTGDTLLRNVQPLYGDFSFGGLAVAHNGNLTNAMTLRKQLIDIGCLFSSTSDTETIVHLIALSKQSSVEDRLYDALMRVEGAYSLVVMAKDMMIGVRDPLGVRPLVMGKLGDAIILASETCALDIVGASYVRDVEPGEIVIVTEGGIRSVKPFQPTPHRFCIFEYVYFSRPDSISEGKNVYEVRQRIGAQLAREAPIDADVVVPVPDSGIPGALGYAKESRIPFELGIIRNHYVGRTFIEPSDQVRHLGVKLKHNGNRAMLDGKRVILVDDSIVRGTTSKKIVNMVREAGAREVHMRIASPPTTHSCFYGVDTPTRDQLLAAKYSVLQMAELIGVDSLAFISLNGMYRAVASINRNNNAPQFCDACFSGDYPIALTDFENATGRKQKDLFAEV